MAVNIVDVQDIKGFNFSHRVGCHDACIIHNPPNGSYSNCVIKINRVVAHRVAGTMTGTECVSMYIKRGALNSATKYYVSKQIPFVDPADTLNHTYDVIVMDTPFYLDQNDSLWVVDGDANRNYENHQFEVLISGEKLTDQASIVHDEDMGVTQGGHVNILAKTSVNEGAVLNFNLYGKASTTYNVTLAQGSTGTGLSTSDFNNTFGASVPASIPWSTTITTNSSGVGLLQLYTDADVSTGEGTESVKLTLDNNNRAEAEVIIEDTSQGVVNITITGRMSRYGQNIGEIRWYLVDTSGNVLFNLSNFDYGQYNTTNGGYSNSSDRNAWTSAANQKSQTVSMIPGTQYHLVVQHVRWNSYAGDFAVDTLEINNANSGTTTFNFDSNNDGFTRFTGSRNDSIQTGFNNRSSVPNSSPEGWYRRSGNTPSGPTGPSSAHSGSYYVFTETSSNNNNSTGRRYQLISPVQTA